LALGEETLNTMATMGYIHFAYYFEKGKVVDTYSVTDSFKLWNKHLRSRRIIAKFKAMIGI
jgi:hypothetical protein